MTERDNISHLNETIKFCISTIRQETFKVKNRNKLISGNHFNNSFKTDLIMMRLSDKGNHKGSKILRNLHFAVFRR